MRIDYRRDDIFVLESLKSDIKKYSNGIKNVK